MHKILVVDDEIDVCDFVKNFFEERNYSVMTALNGEEAIRCVNNNTFDVILLDIKMKKMDGIQVLQQIREMKLKSNIIMVTAVEDQELMKQASKLGACRYITKPLVLEELEGAVYGASRYYEDANGKDK